MADIITALYYSVIYAYIALGICAVAAILLKIYLVNRKKVFMVLAIMFEIIAIALYSPMFFAGYMFLSAFVSSTAIAWMIFAAAAVALAVLCIVLLRVAMRVKQWWGIFLLYVCSVIILHEVIILVAVAVCTVYMIVSLFHF